MTRMGNLIHERLSGVIIGIAMEVLNELKPGLDLPILLNFKNARLDRKRVVRRKPESDVPDLQS